MRLDKDLRSRVAEYYGDDVLFADEHDNAVIGVINRCGQKPFVVYDYEQVISNLESDGMSIAEAAEWISFNWVGAWVGDTTPAILEKLDCI